MSRIPLKGSRRTVQVLTALGMAAVPMLNARDIHLLSGNFLAFNLAGLPLADPLAALQTALSSLDVTTSAALGGGIVLALAFCLGPVFCSWLCPYGLLSELAAAIRRKSGPASGRSGFPARASLAAAGLCLVVLPGWPPLLNQLSMPGWYSRLFQAWQNPDPAEAFAAAAALPVLFLAIEFVLGRRLWCRFLCPQSVLLALAGRLSPASLRVGFRACRCTCDKGREGCVRACSLGLDPRRRPALGCTNCGDCVEACRKRGGALGFAMGRGVKNEEASGGQR